MFQTPSIDGVLVTWGDRLFYPGNRIVKSRPQPKLNGDALRQRAAIIRERIEATVVRRAPQVMVKVTGGGRGMKAITAHFRYISKNGRLDIEDERGETIRGKDAVHELADDWRFGGMLIDDVGSPHSAAPGRQHQAVDATRQGLCFCALRVLLCRPQARAGAQGLASRMQGLPPPVHRFVPCFSG